MKINIGESMEYIRVKSTVSVVSMLPMNLYFPNKTPQEAVEFLRGLGLSEKLQY